MWGFWKNTKVRQAKGKEFRRKLFLEPLEDRRVLAGNIIATLDGSGNLFLTEDPATPDTDNVVTITFTADNLVAVAGSVGTSVNAVPGPGPLVFPVTGSIIASFGGGNDDLDVIGAGNDLTGGGLTYDGGVGANDFELDDLTLGTALAPKDLTVSNAANAAVPASPNSTDIENLDARNIVVSNGSNNSTITLINDSDSTGNVTVANAGGAGTTHNVNVGPGTIGGNLTISNSGPALLYAVSVVDTNVAGNLTIANGASTAGSAINIGGGAVGGNLIAQNGAAAGGNNAILISQTTITGSATLVNGNTSDIATIRLGLPLTVTVGGSLTAINGVSGANNILLDRAVVGAGKATTLVNGATTAGNNLIRLAAGGVATLGGSLTAINGVAAASNRILIFSGTIGTAGSLTDNAILQNGNVGAGFGSLVEIGDTANVALPDGGMTIVDGTGNSVINLIRATLTHATKGNLAILASDGDHTVNLGVGAGAALTVAGGTTVVTGGGIDNLRIGTFGGIAALDRIFGALGAGNDTLDIGAGANGTPGANAFDSTADFLFDGGLGIDTANIAAAVNPLLFGPPITLAAKNRLISFEFVNII